MKSLITTFGWREVPFMFVFPVKHQEMTVRSSILWILLYNPLTLLSSLLLISYYCFHGLLIINRAVKRKMKAVMRPQKLTLVGDDDNSLSVVCLSWQRRSEVHTVLVANVIRKSLWLPQRLFVFSFLVCLVWLHEWGISEQERERERE
jgi:hypothetical protein